MCGLTGILDASGQNSADQLRAATRAMTDAVRHRGPDDSGFWADPAIGVSFGFRRLAVVELSSAGHQPMLSHDGQLVLVFNGEIYNHDALRAELRKDGIVVDWVGHSDTETLLACFSTWGISATLERAVGMFGLAVWDRGARRLHLARDRFGEKPLYYGWAKDVFLFGSELSAIRNYPGFENEIDPNVLSLYMEFGNVPAPYSIYRYVYKVEPGCILSVPLDGAVSRISTPVFAPGRHGALTIERYWSLIDVARRGIANPIEDENEAADRLEAALTTAVRLQSIADVPLGAFLSGGIDSSAIVALMQAQSTRRVKTFTIGFEEAAFNEAEHAKAVAQHLGTEHEQLYVSAQEARDVVPLLPHMYSEPFADSSQIPTHLVSRIARRHVTVTLSGDGGDELFGGYTRHTWVPRIWARLRLLSPAVRRAGAAAIQGVPTTTWDRLGQMAPAGHRISRLGDKAYKLAYGLSHVSSADDLYRMLVTIWPQDSYVVNAAQPPPTFFQSNRPLVAGNNLQHRLMLMDSLTYLPDDILHKVDRASMAVSLETRAPFLDHRVAELAWRLPLHMKIHKGISKRILRTVLYRHVPRALVERPKMGFGVPIDAWLRGPLRDWAEDLLNEKQLREQGYLDAQAIRQKWQEHLSGHRNWPNELWCVLMFQAWQESIAH